MDDWHIYRVIVIIDGSAHTHIPVPPFVLCIIIFAPSSSSSSATVVDDSDFRGRDASVRPSLEIGAYGGWLPNDTTVVQACQLQRTSMQMSVRASKFVGFLFMKGGQATPRKK